MKINNRKKSGCFKAYEKNRKKVKNTKSFIRKKIFCNSYNKQYLTQINIK